MWRRFALTLLLALAALGTGAQGPASGQDMGTPQDMGSPSGLTFPQRLGPTARRDRTDYEPQAPGLGFSYAYRGGATTADIYVYDKGLRLQDGDRTRFEAERDQAVGDISTLVRRGLYQRGEILNRATRPIGAATFATARAAITNRGITVDSFVYVTILHGKFVKIRFSVAASDQQPADAADDFVARFIAAQERRAGRHDPQGLGGSS